MPEGDEELVDDVSAEGSEDVVVEVTDVEVVTLDAVEEEVEEEEVLVVEEEDVIPSCEAPFLTVKMSLTAS
jgi:hypothetical protein